MFCSCSATFGCFSRVEPRWLAIMSVPLKPGDRTAKVECQHVRRKVPYVDWKFRDGASPFWYRREAKGGKRDVVASGCEHYDR